MNATSTRVWSDCDTPLRRLTLTASELGRDGLYFPGRAPERLEAGRSREPFDQVVDQLHEYFAGTRKLFHLPLDLSSGTPFQQAVWRALASDGKLTGYLGGLQRKQVLLDLEAAVHQGHGVPAAVVLRHRELPVRTAFGSM